MPSVLVTYGSGEGQTASVAHYVDSVLTVRGFDVTTRHVRDTADIAVANFDGVLVGVSVRNRRHQPEVLAFVERHRDVLSERPTGFFQLSFASAVPTAWASEEAREWVDDLVESTGWHPDAVGRFGGAVEYTRYGRVERLLFKLLSMATGLGTDTARDYEYTDWDAVEDFADEFADLVESRQGPATTVTNRGPTLALVGLALAGAVYLLFRKRGASRQETLADFERGTSEERGGEEPPSATETVDAAVGPSGQRDLDREESDEGAE